MKILWKIKYILICTWVNAFVLVPFLLMSCAAAFYFSNFLARYTKKVILRFVPLVTTDLLLLFRIVRFVPLVAAELYLFFSMVPYLKRWSYFGSLTWGFSYEGGWNFYLPFTAMVGILIGYLVGMALKKV